PETSHQVAQIIVSDRPVTRPTHVANGRRPKRTLAARKTAKQNTSCRRSPAEPPPGTTNATETAPKTSSWPSVICLVGPRQTEYASTHGISTATRTTHESSSKKRRNHQPRQVIAASLQKFEPTGRSR